MTRRWRSNSRSRRWVQIPDQAIMLLCRCTSPPPSVIDGMSLAAAILNSIHNSRALLECRWASEATFSRTLFLTSPSLPTMSRALLHDCTMVAAVSQVAGCLSVSARMLLLKELVESVTGAGVTLTPRALAPETLVDSGFSRPRARKEMQIHVPRAPHDP